MCRCHFFQCERPFYIKKNYTQNTKYRIDYKRYQAHLPLLIMGLTSFIIIMNLQVLIVHVVWLLKGALSTNIFVDKLAAKLNRY